MNERRRTNRRLFKGEVEILEEVRGQSSTAIARDISVSGMFLMSMAPYQVNDEVTVRFHLPSSSCHIEIVGQVIRVETAHEGTAAKDVGVALRFDDADEWALAEVNRYVAKAPRVAGVVTATNEPPREA
jgi:Tfp pilus assembly protein PilZ